LESVLPNLTETGIFLLMSRNELGLPGYFDNKSFSEITLYGFCLNLAGGGWSNRR
jgi:hypothetical protein